MSAVLAQGTGELVPRIRVGDWAESALDWIGDTFETVFDFAGGLLTDTWEGMVDGLLAPPALVVAGILAVIALLIRSWQFAVATLAGLVLVIAIDMWEPAMYTLAFVLIATVIAVVISVPIGILSARNATARTIVRPILDFMQTMPALVYLVPAVIIFGIGLVPGLVSTIIFALPPGVRLTELGIRQVDGETVEAGQAFGATPRQILRGIQVPLAMPTIMAGINQVIMLALSMAVIAGFAGANGLGKEVVDSISSLNVPQGVEAGVAVVILAIYLDRLTGALGQADQNKGALRHRFRRSQDASAAAPAAVTTVGAGADSGADI